MNILTNAPLDAHNSLALAASAAALVRVTDESTVTQALDWAHANALPALPLGEGSNVVLAGDVDALVLQMATRGVEEIQRSADQVILKVAAGEPWHPFVEWALAQGYCGLENLALIPGTVGAAPIQNIGAYGVELRQFVHRVHGVHLEDAKPFTLSLPECRFAYRDSVFKRGLRDRVLITSVELTLPLTAAPNISYPALAEALGERAAGATPRQVFDAVVALRRARLPDPVVEPNAGSFFKNPVLSRAAYDLLKKEFDLPAYPQPDGQVKVPAAWLIERCGWKGRQVAGQGVHPDHALVLVNYGNANGADLLGLAARIQADVETLFDVQLEIEPRVYGQKP